MSERDDDRSTTEPAARKELAQAVGVGVQTALVDNSAAFGFSITVTASYGALNQLAGQPSLLDVGLFAGSAAAAFTVLQAAATRGFRRRPGTAPREVILLGTAFDIVSVVLGLGAAILVGVLLPAPAAWPTGAFSAALVFALAQAAELAVAARVERRRGDRRAEPALDEDGDQGG